MVVAMIDIRMDGDCAACGKPLAPPDGHAGHWRQEGGLVYHGGCSKESAARAGRLKKLHDSGMFIASIHQMFDDIPRDDRTPTDCLCIVGLVQLSNGITRMERLLRESKR